MNQVLEMALRYADKGYCVVPINPYTKKPFFAIEEFQTRYSTKEEIQKRWKEFPSSMIGLMTGNISKLFVLDLDPKHDREKINELIPDSVITPTSKTPRGGIHLYFKDPGNKDITIKSALMPDVDYRCNGGYIIAPPSRNGYGRGYQWLDNLSLFEVDPHPMPEALYKYILNNLHYKSVSKKDGVINSYISGIDFLTEGKRNEDLFHISNSLVKGRLEEEIIFEVLKILAQNAKPPFPENEISTIIESAFKRAKRRERNLTEDISNWVSLQTGYFSVTESYKELQVVTSEDKNAARQAFARLCKQEIIEKHGEKTGIYRLIESNSDEIDFLAVEDQIIDILWPFEIQEWVKILPKNIIVVAGEVNAGKTAFLLNVCFINMGKFKINYFSSEMGAMELRDRLKKFEVNLTHWKQGINFRERSSNFADVIKPNDVNIIDFLEITDEFYKVGGMIKEIYDKLKKGIAILALQKNPKTDIGLGGMRSIEKARLYLSIENGRIKIVKGKNWAGTYNPNGISRRFKLVQGAKFIPTTDWQRE